MSAQLDAMSRQTAARLLLKVQQLRAQTAVTDALLLDGSDWEHPRTAEAGARADTLMGTLESLLAYRAGPQAECGAP